MAYDAPGEYRETPSHTETAFVALARVLEVEDDRARVRIGANEQWVAIDASVDPALVDSARLSGARVVLELGAEAVLVGTLMTARAPEIDRKGNLELRVAKFVVQAEEVLLKTPRSFLRLRREDAELLGDELIARGRLLTRLLGKTIKIN